jgi:hypothetical protein
MSTFSGEGHFKVITANPLIDERGSIENQQK